MSQRSISTTQQTGDLYSAKFSDGFKACNEDIMEGGDWLLNNFDIKGHKKGIKEMVIIGDVDFCCLITKDTSSKALFPSTSSTSDVVIKEKTLLLMEVTSMSGELALSKVDTANKTKVQRKLAFFNNLFRPVNMRLFNSNGVDSSKYKHVLVVFIYNGIDPVEMRSVFQSMKFCSLLVHLPLTYCLDWSNSIVLENALAAKEQAEKDKAEAEERNKLIICNMKKKNMDIETIASITGLTEESINKILA